MTTTMTTNDLLVELGDLTSNKDVTIQRAGAEMIEAFLNTHNEGDNVSDATLAQILFYLTDIQVRDYALGLINPNAHTLQFSALNCLLEAAPVDTPYINAPACLLAALYYEVGDKDGAFLSLSNAQNGYSLGLLLYRVFKSGWEPTSFAAMRNELHPKVTASIFGEETND